MPLALLSVSDKRGLVDLGRGLVEMGWGLLASGGTARALREAGLPVREVSQATGSPEVLGGRVKTLHPAVFAGLLARPTPEDLAEIERMGWQAIDMAVVNLYPFEQSLAKGASETEMIEHIDIGGVALIRAAAKNHARVTLLCDPLDYSSVLEEIRNGGVPAEMRRRLAMKGFALTAHYDAAISAWMNPEAMLSLPLYPSQSLRYGENPHQSARLYSHQPGGGPLGGTVLQGKELSYNNLLDLDAAWRAAVGFDTPAAVIVKHLSPCGIACADHISDAYRLALACDPVSAFGGVVAFNRRMDAETAQAVRDLFVECIAAPGFDPGARSLLAGKKNLRLLEMPDQSLEPPYELRSVLRGVLKQDLDLGDPPQTEWKVVSQRAPSQEEWRALRFAWQACRHVKSNAIVLAGGTATVGIGGGQPNRVDAVRIAVQRAGERARGAVLASDAFFPFADSIEEAARAGVTAAIHPGGSLRDSDSVAAADRAGMALVVTGVRHFRH